MSLYLYVAKLNSFIQQETLLTLDTSLYSPTKLN